MGNKLTELVISFNKRTARLRGPTSSYDWNDSIEELGQDLAGLYNLWNNSLVPLVSLIPDGVRDGTINAYSAGLDGRTLYVNADSTDTSASSYFNTGKSRPNTVYEQIQSLYQYIDNKVNVVHEQVLTSSSASSASDIPIADTGDILTSNNVEDALQEVMNLVTKTGASHSALTNLSSDDHSLYLPRTGVRAMSGALQMGGYAITNAGNIGCTNLTATSTVTAAIGTINGTLYVENTLTCLSTITGQVKVWDDGTLVGSPYYLDSTTGNAPYDYRSLSNGLITTYNAVSQQQYYLPDGDSEITNIGAKFTFYVYQAVGMKILMQDNLDHIRIGSSLSSAGAGGGGYISSTTVGNSITLVLVASHLWAAVETVGTWTVN